MNFAILSRIRAVSGHPSEHIKELILAAHRQRVKGFYEVAYYLSMNDPQEFYTLTTWYNLEAVPDHRQEQKNPAYNQVLGRIQLKEQTIFRLSWEYRRVEVKPGLSVLRLATFPKDYPAEWLNESESAIKEQARQSPGFIGAWMGYNLERIQSDGKLVRLLRGDWDYKESFLNYVNSPVMQSLTLRSKAAGVIGELASIDLQDIVRSPISEHDTPHVSIKNKVL